MLDLIKAWVQTLREEQGAAMVEYGILIAGIAVAVIATVFLLGPAINTMFNTVLTKIGGG